MDAGALGGLCGCCRVEVLAHNDPVSQEPAWDAHRNRTLQAGTGADLDQGSLGGVMEKLAKPMTEKTSASHWSRSGQRAMNRSGRSRSVTELHRMSAGHRAVLDGSAFLLA